MNTLLDQYRSEDGMVDYESLKQNPSDVEEIIAIIQSIDPEGLHHQFLQLPCNPRDCPGRYREDSKREYSLLQTKPNFNEWRFSEFGRA